MNRTSRTSRMKRCARTDRCCWILTFHSSHHCCSSPTSHPSSPDCPKSRRSGHDPSTNWTSCRSTRSSDRRRSCPTHCGHPPASSTTPSSPRHRPCSSRSTTRADPGPTLNVRRPATNCRDPGSSSPTRRSCCSGRCSMSLRCSGRDLPYTSPPKPVDIARSATRSLPACLPRGRQGKRISGAALHTRERSRRRARSCAFMPRGSSVAWCESALYVAPHAASTTTFRWRARRARRPGRTAAR